VGKRERERVGKIERDGARASVRNVIGTGKASTSSLAAENRHYVEIIIPVGEEREKLSQHRNESTLEYVGHCAVCCTLSANTHTHIHTPTDSAKTHAHSRVNERETETIAYRQAHMALAAFDGVSALCALCL